MNKALFLTTLLGLMACGPGKQEPSQSNTPDTPKETKKTIEIPGEVESVLSRRACLGCHKVDKKLIGPSYLEIAKRFDNSSDIVDRIRNPKPDNWPGYPPMVGIPVSDEEGELLASWILSLRTD